MLLPHESTSLSRYLESELVQDELSLGLDLSDEAKLAVRDTLGEAFSDPVSLLEVVWFEPRDSTDHEERSSDLPKINVYASVKTKKNIPQNIVFSSSQHSKQSIFKIILLFFHLAKRVLCMRIIFELSKPVLNMSYK